MAGAGYKLFNTGDVLTAAQVNTYLQEQAVMRFANATARTTALSGVLAEGMVTYLDDTNAVEVYDGSNWVGISSSGDITGVTAGTGISGGGTSGTVTVTNAMATAIDAKGDLIAGTGADAFARLAAGTNDFVLTAASGETTGLKWDRPLAAYQAVRTTGTNITTTSNTFVAADTTNLRITATPRSTYAIGILNGYTVVALGGSNNVYWRLDCGSGTSYGQMIQDLNYTATNIPNMTVLTIITGLTAGTSYNFDWQFRTTSSATHTLIADSNLYYPKMVVIC